MEEQERTKAKEPVRVSNDKKVVDWTEREDIQKEMRRGIKSLLESNRTLGLEILSLARIQFRDV